MKVVERRYVRPAKRAGITLQRNHLSESRPGAILRRSALLKWFIEKTAVMVKMSCFIVVASSHSLFLRSKCIFFLSLSFF